MNNCIMGISRNHSTYSTPSHGRQLARGSIQGFIGSAVSLPTGIVTAAFLSRQLGPDQYGVLSTVCFMIAFIETAISLGFEQAAVKVTAESSSWQADAGIVLRGQILVSGAAALLVALAAPLAAGWMNTDDIAFYLWIYAVGIPVAGMAKIHQAVIVGRGYYHLRAWLNGGYWFVRMILVIGLVLIKPSVTAVIVANIASTAIVLVAARAIVKPAVFHLRTETGFRQLWLYAWPLYFFTMCLHLSQAMDLILVKAWLPPENAGFYAAAKNLAIVPGLVTLSLAPVLLSKLSLLISLKDKRQAGRLLEYTRRSTVCMLPFAGMSAGAAGEVVQLIYGDDFGPAGPLLAVLIFGALSMTMSQVNTAGLIAAGKTRLPLSILGPLIPLTILAHYWAIGAYGILGAAVTTATASILTLILTNLSVKRFWEVQSFPALWLKSTVLAVVAFLAAAYWDTHGFLLFFKLGLISAGIVAALWCLGEFSLADLQKIMRPIRIQNEN